MGWCWYKWHRHGSSLVRCWAANQRVSVSGPTTLLVVKVRNRAVNGWGPQYPLKSVASNFTAHEFPWIAQFAIVTVCGDFFPFPRLNSHSHHWSYSHSHGNPMGSQSFPFPCTPTHLLYSPCIVVNSGDCYYGRHSPPNTLCSMPL